MEYRSVGRSGVKVSVFGLGSYLTIGYKADPAEARAMVRVAYERGVNYIDTANAYNAGQAEEFLGVELAQYPRAALFVLTKVWAPMGKGPNDRGLSAKHIKEQCAASLRRLKMEYVDLYMCHRPDPATPLEETIRAMDDLVRAGKILYWGVSEWPAWMMVKAQCLAREMGAPPLVVNEPRYSLLWRYPEHEEFDVAQREGIGNVVFSPLAHGMLTGKYQPGMPPSPGTRAADPDQNAVIMKLYWNEENQRKGQELAKLATALGTNATRLALAWCLRHPAVTSVILGTRTVAQLEDNLRALEVRIPPEALAQLDALYPRPFWPKHE
jgi:aryl-alcohol dehydrogenase-like predicted oxidoreductase